MLKDCKDKIMTKKELTEKNLESISGGSNENVIVQCSYTCPICGQTHTFNAQWKGLSYGFDIVSYSACAKTASIIKNRSTDQNDLYITDTSGKNYSANYTEDKIIM